MACNEAPGWWNCCTVCLLHYSTFDCCLGGGCYDENYETVASSVIPDWDYQHSTGSWRQGWSTQPRYSISEFEPCNDGAMYETSGSGVIRLRVPNNDLGALVQLDVLELRVGTHFKLHILCHEDDPLGGLIADVTATELISNPTPENPYGQTLVIVVTIAGCTFTGGIDYTEGYPNRLSLSVGTDSTTGRIGLSFGRDDTYQFFEHQLCGAGTPDGKYFAIENASGSIPLEVDDVAWLKLSSQEVAGEVDCFGWVGCGCLDPESQHTYLQNLPDIMYLWLQWECVDRGPEIVPGDFELQLTLTRRTIAECADCGAAGWEVVLDSGYCPEGGPGGTIVINCGSTTEFELWATGFITPPIPDNRILFFDEDMSASDPIPKLRCTVRTAFAQRRDRSGHCSCSGGISQNGWLTATISTSPPWES